MQDPSEDELIAWLRGRLRGRLDPDLLGDDAAVLDPPAEGGRLVATVDSQIAGVHYPAGLDPALVAARLVAVNLSDVAATGADPTHALLALSAPAGYDRRRFFAGLLPALREHGVVLAGGDLASTGGGPAVATLTVLGRVPAGREPLRRGAARPGDALWVGGTLGGSAAGRHLLAAGAAARAGGELDDDPSLGLEIELPPGLPAALAEAGREAVARHLLPAPQLALGRALAEAAARRGRPAAAIDLSDGLSTDLGRLCRESGCGAEVVADELPVDSGLAGLAGRLGRPARELALSGGEDYVLLFTLPDGEDPPGGPGARRIGRITEGSGAVLVTAQGAEPLTPAGWDHLAAER